MKIHTSDKAIAWLTLLSGLTISAVAIYYSVAGLTAIFAAAVIPIIVMGVALEISKLAATVWLKQNWHRAPNFIRGYLLAAIAILMVITSMGIFGFLSKAHSDQSLVSGDVQSKIAIYDQKIQTAKDNIEAARKALKQMDEAVDQTMARSTSEAGATKANNIRRAQQRERSALAKDIETNQKLIATLNEESAPIRAEIRKVEAEVGPIKYIAALIYGDNPDANLLEKAVTWVIIVIVIVFDPLAVILLLASQYSFQWFREEKDNELPEEPIEVNEEPLPEPESTEYVHSPWPFIVREQEETPKTNSEALESQEPKFDEVKPLEEWPEETVSENEEQEFINSSPENEKQAMAAWKRDNPNKSLKLQRHLLERGVIKELPWLKYIKPKEEYTEDQEAAVEAAKWAQEQLEQKSEISWMEHDEHGNQIKRTKEGYQQNAEQGENTIWKRIQEAKK